MSYTSTNPIMVTASLLNHPAHANGLVAEGDPCCVGALAGFAGKSAAAATDEIPLMLNDVGPAAVTAGAAAISFGTQLYLDPSACTLSNTAGGLPFGASVDTTTIAAGQSGTIQVRVSN
jgi:hypothetical protein